MVSRLLALEGAQGQLPILPLSQQDWAQRKAEPLKHPCDCICCCNHTSIQMKALQSLALRKSFQHFVLEFKARTKVKVTVVTCLLAKRDMKVYTSQSIFFVVKESKIMEVSFHF